MGAGPSFPAKRPADSDTCMLDQLEKVATLVYELSALDHGL